MGLKAAPITMADSAEKIIKLVSVLNDRVLTLGLFYGSFH